MSALVPCLASFTDPALYQLPQVPAEDRLRFKLEGEKQRQLLEKQAELAEANLRGERAKVKRLEVGRALPLHLLLCARSSLLGLPLNSFLVLHLHRSRSPPSSGTSSRM